MAEFKFELTGALGKRTRFQEHSFAQLVILAQSRDGENSHDSRQQPKPVEVALNDDQLLDKVELGDCDKRVHASLRPLDQCILLALSLNMKNEGPSDGLAAQEIESYVTVCGTRYVTAVLISIQMTL